MSSTSDADKMDVDPYDKEIEKGDSPIAKFISENEADGGGAVSVPKGGTTAPLKLSLGLRLEAKDYSGLWYPAKVMDIDEAKQLAHVHFEGWSSRFDEWISLGDAESRLRPLLRHSQRRDSEKSKRHSSIDGRTDFYVGEIILARWTDCRMYPAKILVANPASFDVVFYDGFRKTVQHANVKPMTKEVRREFHLPDDGSAGNACLFGEKKKMGKQAKNAATTTTVALFVGSGAKTSETSKLSKEDAAEEEEERKSKKRKRTITLESGGDLAESAAAAAQAIAASPTSKSNSLGSVVDDNKGNAKKGRGRPPTVEKTCGGGGVGGATASPAAVASVKRPKRDPEEGVAKDEWKCNVKECAKTFRKESLLAYHLKYYHLEEKTGVATVPKMGSPVAKVAPVPKTPASSKTSSGAFKEVEDTSSTSARVEDDESPTVDADAAPPLTKPSSKEATSMMPVDPATPAASNATTTKNQKPLRDDDGFPVAPAAASTPTTPYPPTGSRKRKRHPSPTPDDSLVANSPSARSSVSAFSDEDETTLEFASLSAAATNNAWSTPKLAAFSSADAAAAGSRDGVVPHDERIRCVCQIYEVTPESGRMLRCGRCKSWQHSSCFILPEDEDDESYLCYICSHPPGIRDSKRRLEEVEKYLTSGELARFPAPRSSTSTWTATSTTSTAAASLPEVRPPMTYGKNDAATAAKSNSLDTLAAVNLRGRDSQAGFFKAVGQSVNNVCAGIHRLNDCLHGSELRLHRLKAMLDGDDATLSRGDDDDVDVKREEGVGMQKTLAPGTSGVTAEGSSVSGGPEDVSTSAPSGARTSRDIVVAAESARINAEHDAMEARLAAMEAEMEEVERLWDASEEFVSLPPGKKVGEETPSSSKNNATGGGNGELENRFRIKRALRGLIDDLNQVQQIAFLQTVKHS